MDRKKCEFCGEEIHINSKRCPFCGSILKDISQDTGFEIPPVPIEFNQEKNDEQHQQNADNQDAFFNERKDDKIEQGPVVYGDKRDSNIYVNRKVRPLSNSIKVFLAALSAFPPGAGQLIGIIASIIFMSEEDSPDRKSYGKALLVSSLIFFVIWGMVICCAMLGLAGIGEMMKNPEQYID